MSDAELNATESVPWSVVDQLFDGHRVVRVTALLAWDWVDDHPADAEELLPEAQRAIEGFIHDLLHLGEEFKYVSVKFQSKTPTQLRATMVLVGNSLKKPNEQLMKSSLAATQTREQLMTALNRGFMLISELGSNDVSQELAFQCCCAPWGSKVVAGSPVLWCPERDGGMMEVALAAFDAGTSLVQ